MERKNNKIGNGQSMKTIITPNLSIGFFLFFYFVIISGQIVQQTNDNFKLMEFILKLYSDKKITKHKRRFTQTL